MIGVGWIKSDLCDCFNNELILKMGQPRPFFRLVSVFSNKTRSIFTTNQFKKKFYIVYGAGIRTHDLTNINCHPQPLDQGSRPSDINLLTYVTMTEW